MNMAGLQDNALRIVLVGKTGSGKSATANTILGRREFDSKITPAAVTKSCQKASRDWKGSNLLVVDTPGLFDTEETLETTCEEVSQCVLVSCPGPHAVILVMQLGRYTEEERNTVKLIKAIFGEPAMKYMIILFTRKDQLEGQELSDFLAEADEELQDLIKECGDRCCAFNNKLRGVEDKDAQVQELVGMIEEMVLKNGGSHFSNDIYSKTNEKLQHQIEALKKTYSDELWKKIKEVKQKYAQGNISLQEKEEELKSINAKYDDQMKNVREEAENNIFADIVKWIKKILKSIWDIFW